MRFLRSRSFWLWTVYVAMMGVLVVGAMRDGDWWLLVVGGILGLIWAVAEDLLARRQGTGPS
jgi:quinol-cytochrome oxidoreductase complex cytochrome b subunit